MKVLHVNITCLQATARLYIVPRSHYGNNHINDNKKRTNNKIFAEQVWAVQ